MLPFQMLSADVFFHEGLTALVLDMLYCGSSSNEIKDPEPQPPLFVSLNESEYNGRKFYGDGMGCNGHADMRSEITYLRDWKAWAERQLRSFHALERSLNEAFNSGDGSYRP